jgi:CMP-N-acetylneuraminic acid synthetase
LELLKVPELTGIVVSSDNDEMLAVAAKYEGVETRKREDYYASDTVTHSEYFEHIAAAEVGDADEVLYAPVTSPLVEAADYSNLIQAFRASSNTESAGDAILRCNTLFISLMHLSFHA